MISKYIMIFISLLILTTICQSVYSKQETPDAAIKVIVSKRIEIIDVIKGLKQCAGIVMIENKIEIKDVIIMIKNLGGISEN